MIRKIHNYALTAFTTHTLLKARKYTHMHTNKHTCILDNTLMYLNLSFVNLFPTEDEDPEAIHTSLRRVAICLSDGGELEVSPMCREPDQFLSIDLT